MNVEREISNIKCFLSFWVILPANQRLWSFFLGGWLAPTLKFSEIAIAPPWYHYVNAETLRRNVQQLKMAA
jgi:hypothetical protein